MFDALAESLAQTIEGNPWLAPLAAFVGGLLTAANPCVVAMAPLMVAYVAGQQTRSVRRSFLLSLTFTIGLTAMFGLLYLATWTASSVLRAGWWAYVASAVCLLMGLHLLGVMNWRLPAPAIAPKRRGLIGAFLLGLLFGLVSLPCAGPILLTLLALIPVKGAAFGGTLLITYSFGHCGLVLLGGTSMGLVQRVADSRNWNFGVSLMRKLAGGVIVVVGLRLLFG